MKFEGVIWDNMDVAGKALGSHVEAGGFKKHKTFWLVFDEPCQGVFFYAEEPPAIWDVTYRYDYAEGHSVNPWYRSRAIGRGSRRTPYKRGFWMYGGYWSKDWTPAEEAYGTSYN